MEQPSGNPTFGNQSLSIAGSVTISGHTANFGQIGQYYTGVVPRESSANPNSAAVEGATNSTPEPRVEGSAFQEASPQNLSSSADASNSATPINKEIQTLENELNVQNMYVVASNIGSQWAMLARLLPGGLTEADIQRIDVDARANGADSCERSFQMLLRWKQTASSGATLGKLAQALVELGRRDIVDQLRL